MFLKSIHEHKNIHIKCTTISEQVMVDNGTYEVQMKTILLHTILHIKKQFLIMSSTWFYMVFEVVLI